MSFDSWLDEMINRAKTVEKQCVSKGVSPKVMEMLLDRSIEPYGLWKGSGAGHMSIPPEEMKAALEAVKRKYKLKELDNLLIPEEYMEKSTYQKCSTLLKDMGYTYDKDKKAFRKEVH
jgi:hypothetical protein